MKKITFFSVCFMSVLVFTQTTARAQGKKNVKATVTPSADAAATARAEEADRLIETYMSFASFESMMDELMVLAHVQQQDKAGYYTMIYDKFMYVDRRQFIKDVDKGLITQANIKQYLERLKTEYAGYYQNALLKGIPTLVPDDAKPHHLKSLNNPPNPNPAATCGNNLDFEQGNFTGWTGHYATFNCATVSTPNPWQFAGLDIGPNNSLNNQHTLMTTGFDPSVGGNILPCLWPQGGMYSSRLGDVNDGCGEADFSFSFLVTSSNTNFTYAYACIMNNGHPVNAAPKFIISMTGSTSGNIACGAYYVDAVAASSDPTFFPIPNTTMYYKKWTPVFVDLTPYIGQTVTITFTTSDCLGGAHRGYAYIDCICGLANNNILDYCPGATAATLVAPTGAQTYTWSGPSGPIPPPAGNHDTLIVNNPNLGDTYTVTLTNVAGCQSSLTTTINYTPITSAVSSIPTCTGGNSGTASVSPSGGNINGVYSYSWNTSPPQTTQTATNLAAGTYTVHITSPPCTTFLDTVVTVASAPTTPLTDTTNYCSTTSATLHTRPGSVYQWYDNNGVLINAPLGTADSIVVANPTSGSYYHYTFTNLQGCRDSVNMLMLYNPPNPFFNITNTCAGGNTGALALMSTPTGYTYTWTGPNNYSAGNVTSVNGLAAGNYTVTMRNGGCVYSMIGMISAAAIPSPLTGVQKICTGDLADTLHAPGGYSVHNWYLPNGNMANGASATTANYIFSTSVPGVYIDTMRTAAGCIQVFADTVQKVFVSATSTTTNETCYMDSVGMINVVASGGVSGNFTYSWAGPNGYTSTSAIINSLKEGTYICTIRDHGCLKKDTVVITGPAMPKDTLQITTTMCDGDTSAVLHFTGGAANYTWYLNNVPVTPVNSPATPDSLRIYNTMNYPFYSVTFMANGCRRKASLVVRTVPPPLFEPNKTTNVFTPNSDNGMAHGGNDRFYPYPAEMITMSTIEYYTLSYRIEIYDRWGTLMYESTDYKEGWDGKYKGKEVAAGTYYWITNYTPRCAAAGTDIVNKGFVQVVR